MRLILLGAPGVGKGVQGNLLKEKFNIPKISTGDILRENIKDGTPEGNEAQEYMSAGKLVPDSLINRIVEKRIQNEDCRDGFIFDGYPRTVPQAEFLSEVMNKTGNSIDKVISIEVDKDVIIERLSSRRVCLSCGEVYNMITDSPPENGICRVCGSRDIVLRDDDRPETIKKRFEVYDKDTSPLKEYYKNSGFLIEADGDGDIDKIHKNIVMLIV